VSEFFDPAEEEVVESLLPVEDEPPSPEEELARADEEAEEFPESDDLIATEEERLPIARSWAFDFEHNRFARGLAAQGPAETRGVMTLRYWIEKCLRTARGAHPIHPEEYGIDRSGRGVYGAPLAQTRGADLEQRIRDALMFHDAISEVTEYESSYSPDDDLLSVSFHVVLDDDVVLEITDLAIGATG
jgi:hypothetical protein